MPTPTNTKIGDILAGVVRKSIIAIVAAANRTQLSLDEYVAGQRLTLDDDAIRALVFGGSTVAASLSESFKSRMLRIITGSLNQSWQSGLEARQAETAQAGMRYRWTLGATTSGTHCPDCSARDGQVETMEQWEVIGKPSSGFSVCNTNCKCRLEPVR
jgi:hypothetical protein